MAYQERVLDALQCFSDPARRPDYFSLYSDDIVFHGYEGVEPGIASVKEYYARFWSAFPDAVIDAEDCLEKNDKVTVRFTVRGTHRGPLSGLAATFHPICLPGIAILRFAGGKCAERWTTIDSSLLLRQLQQPAVTPAKADQVDHPPARIPASENLARKPHASEYPSHAGIYMRWVRNGISVLEQLQQNRDATIRLLANLPEDVLLGHYAPDKWTIKDILSHISDDERIYVYRALRFARMDDTVLPGFDQDLFARHARANERSIGDLIQEFVSVRAATLSFFASLNDEALMKSGMADGKRSTVRALAFHIAGHELHHVDMIRRLYLPENHRA